MKRLCLVIVALLVLLCGCRDNTITETGHMDFDKLDKEYGQFQNNNGDKAEAYADEMEKIYANINEYVDLIMTNDARAMVNSFSSKLINFLAEVNGVSYEDAKEIAQERVQKTFDESEIYDLKEAWQRNAHQVEITQIKIFPQRTEIKEAYLSCGIKIIDAITVKFKVIDKNEERESKIRLVQFENGGWAADADYFF